MSAWRSRSDLWRAVVGLVTVALLAACAHGKATTSRPARRTVDRSLVTVRAIKAQSPAPCGPPTGPAELFLPDPANPALCLALDSAGFDAAGIATARLIATGPTDMAVELDLNEAGKRTFTQLAAAHLGERLAIVVNGRVASTPPVQAPDSTAIEVSGLTAGEATDLVRAFGGDTTPPTTPPGQEDVDRASKICDDYGSRTGQINGDFASPTTAGDVTSTSRRALDRAAPPWDSLPADHFVARCSYPIPPTEAPSTTVCPTRDIVDLRQPKSMLVDEEGRATDDPTVDAVGINPCP